jgi:hypothetical protein
MSEAIVTSDYWCADCGETTHVHHPDGQKPPAPPCDNCAGGTAEVDE